MRDFSTPAPAPAEASPPASHRRRSREVTSTRLGDQALRLRLVRLALAPAATVAVICIAAALVVFHGTVTTVDRTTGLLVLVVGLVLIGCVLLAAISSAAAQERAMIVRTTARQAALSRFAVSGHHEVAELLHRVVYEHPPFHRRAETATTSFGPAADSLIEEIAAAQLAAEAAVLELAPKLHQHTGLGPSGLPVRPGTRNGEPHPVRGGSPEQFEVFANLSHRLQSLVHREIGLLDELENEIEDPDFLKSIFRVDHLATRVRRYAENLAVLGGAVPSRQWTRAVSVSDVLRSAVAEIELVLGTICVIDQDPRRWGREGLEFIKSRAARIVEEIERPE